MVPTNYMPPIDPPIGNAQRRNQLVNDGGGQGNDILLKQMEDLTQQMDELRVRIAITSNQ